MNRQKIDEGRPLFSSFLLSTMHALIYLSSVKEDDEDIHCRLHSKPCLKGRLLCNDRNGLLLSKAKSPPVGGGTKCYCQLSVVSTII